MPQSYRNDDAFTHLRHLTLCSELSDSHTATSGSGFVLLLEPELSAGTVLCGYWVREIHDLMCADQGSSDKVA